MILSPTKGFVFFKPMKTAGSSVEFALSKSCGVNDLITGGSELDEIEKGFRQQNNLYYDNNKQKYFNKFHSHTTPELLKERISEDHFLEIENLIWITMVRNPWDMIVSYFWWCLYDYPEINKWAIPTSAMKKDKIQDIFYDFMFCRKGTTSSIVPGEFEHDSPWKYICKYNLAMIDNRIDHYIRFEFLQEDFDVLSTKLNIQNVEMPRFKTTQKKIKRHYSFYYNDAAKQIVGNAFKDYIEKFDYRFEWKNRGPSRRERAKRRQGKK